jgi:hypothetical protein
MVKSDILKPSFCTVNYFNIYSPDLMYLSRKEYTLITNKDVFKIKTALLLNTLVKNRLIRVLTAKRFIGQVNDDGFRLIGSGKIGVLCVLEGKFEISDKQTTAITVKTKLHKAFLVLFIIWIIALLALMILVPVLTKSSPQPSAESFLVFFIAACFFRFMIHVAYVIARNFGIKSLNNLLE